MSKPPKNKILSSATSNFDEELLNIYLREDFLLSDNHYSFLYENTFIDYSWEKSNGGYRSIYIHPEIVEAFGSETISNIKKLFGLDENIIPVGVVNGGDLVILLSDTEKIYLGDGMNLYFGGEDFDTFVDKIINEDTFDKISRISNS